MTKKADYSKFKKAPPEDKLTQLKNLVDQLKAARVALEHAQVEAKIKEQHVINLEEHQIPDLMMSIELDNITIGGLHLQLEDQIHPSISDANKEAAFKLLKSWGEGGAIKNEIKLVYRMGEEEKAIAFIRQQEAEGNGSRIKRREFVEPGTLKSIVKGYIEEHGPLDEKCPITTFRKKVVKTS